MELNGRTAIITGAGRGVGRALAIEFARRGANVACCARREHEIKQTVELIEAEGGSGLAIPVDVTDQAQTQDMARRALDRFGAIDVLFNNAGSFVALGGVWEVDADQWWWDVTVNLRGSMLCARAVLPHMMQRDEGVIIHMAGGNKIPGGTAYSCSKMALPRLTELMARELQHEGSNVLVFTMGPGFVVTALTQHQVDSPQGRKWLPSTADAVAQGDHRPPQDCAKATMELLRVACPQLSGRSFGVDTDFDKVVADLEKPGEQG